MALQTVTFFGQDKTLSQDLLNKLFKGVAHISLLPYDKASAPNAGGPNEGGIKWEGLSFRGADEIFTIRDSFQIAQADASEENINVDQFDTPIDSTTTPGDWTFSGNIPSVAAQLCDIFYKKGKAVAKGEATGIVGQEGTQYAGQAYFGSPVEVYAVMLVENTEMNLALAFARVKITVGMSKDDSSSAYLKMSGRILANTEKSGKEGDWATLGA